MVRPVHLILKARVFAPQHSKRDQVGNVSVKHHSNRHVQHRRRTDVQLTLDMQQLAPFPRPDTLEGEGLIKRDGETLAATAYGLW